LTLTFKLIQARDQTRLPCEFGVNPFSGSRDTSYTNKTKQTGGTKNRTFRSSVREVTKLETVSPIVVKATALKQQISKFYPQILSTEANFAFMAGH